MRRACRRQPLGWDMVIMNSLSCPLAWRTPRQHSWISKPSVQTISRLVCDYFFLKHSDLLEVLRGAWDILADCLVDFARALAIRQAIQVWILIVGNSIPWPRGVVSWYICGFGQGWGSSQIGEIEVGIRNLEFLWSCRTLPTFHIRFLLDSSSSHTVD